MTAVRTMSIKIVEPKTERLIVDLDPRTMKEFENAKIVVPSDFEAIAINQNRNR